MLIENYSCPRCKRNLEPLQTEIGLGGSCLGCRSRVIGTEFLKTVYQPEMIDSLLEKAVSRNKRGSLACPSCQKPMLVITAGPDAGHVELDICPGCKLIWFDQNELDRLPERPQKKGDIIDILYMLSFLI